MGVNPRAPARGLKRPFRDKSNPSTKRETEYIKCRRCGKVFRPLRNTFYCDECETNKDNSTPINKDSYAKTENKENSCESTLIDKNSHTKTKNRDNLCIYCGHYYPQSEMADSKICSNCSNMCKSCGKIFPKSELNINLICNHCIELKKIAAGEICKHCGKSFPPSEKADDRLCRECASICLKCGNIFPNSEMATENTCNRCYSMYLDKPMKKICHKCFKSFVPDKSYYTTCPECFNR